MKKWHLALGFLISALFLWIAFRSLDWAEAWKAIQNAQYWWLLPGIAIYFVGVWARTWRWHYLLRPMKRVPLATLFPIVVIGYMGNNVYPARAGELVRAYVLKRKEGVNVSGSLATILVERVFDGLVMLLFVFLGLPLVPSLSGSLRQVVIIGSLAFFGALLVFLVLAARPDHAQGLADWFIHRLAPSRFRASLSHFTARFLEGFACLRSPRDLVMTFITSLVIWLCETTKYWFVLHAFPALVPNTSFFALMLMNGVVNLATTLPAAPGYVGTFDAPGIEILKAFGNDPNIATAYTLVLHAALWLPITLLGIYYMARESLSWADFGRATHLGEAEGSTGDTEGQSAAGGLASALSTGAGEGRHAGEVGSQ